MALVICLIPHIRFIIFHAVFFQEHPELILKRPCLVVLLLTVNVGTQRIQIRRADGKTSVASLPRKRREAGRLGFHPFRRGGFQRLHQIRDGDGARKTDGEVNMVGHSANAIRFASGVARDRGQIGVEIWAHVRIKEWAAFFRAEDDVDDDEAQ